MSTDARIKQLERAAVEFHRRGLLWSEFHREHGESIAELAPFDAAKYRRIVRRLLALVCSGDLDGMDPPGTDPEPWLADDQVDTSVDDTHTEARLQSWA